MNTVSAWLLLLVALATVAIVIIVARLATRIGAAMDSLRVTTDRVGELVPQISRVLSEVEREAHELHDMTARTNRIMADVEIMVHQTQRVSLDILNVLGFLDVTRRAGAVMAGAKAGLAMLKGVVSRR